MTLDDSVASTDLQNPADALEFLAHVAERDSGSKQLPTLQTSMFGRSLNQNSSDSRDQLQGTNQQQSTNMINFPPLIKGQLSLDMIQTLLYRYAASLSTHRVNSSD